MIITAFFCLSNITQIDIAALLKQLSVEQVKAHLDEIIDECFGQAKAKADSEGGFLTLERGFATIPLPGIDVPFHSRYLWAGVMPFRTYLSKKIDAKGGFFFTMRKRTLTLTTDLNPDMLIGKYIPNLVAKPFEISKPYIEMIFNQTSSPRLEKVLKDWDSGNWSAAENRQVLAYTTLVELLAYQFASPVRWIETQDLLFTHYNFERLVEIGPSPTLSGMANRTQKLKYEALDTAQAITRTVLCHAKNQKEIYYEMEDEVEETPASAEESAPASAAPSAPAPAAVAAAPAPAPAAGGAPADVPDEPLQATDTLRIIIAQKLKKSVAEVQLSKSIKDLVGGKSTLQNEILGDLQTEFGNAPEKGEELPLDELGSALNVGYAGSLGKFSAGLVSRMIGSKMPGGFNLSSVKTHLSKTWGLGPQRQEAVLLFGVTMEPAKRLGSEPEAKQWVDSVAQAYASQAGISLTTASAGGGGGGAAAGVTISSEELDKFRAEQNDFAAHQIDAYMRYLNRDPRAGHRLHEQEKQNGAALQDRLDAIAREHGDAYINGIMSSFEPLKARTFDSSWNWARQDALAMFYDIIFGRLTAVDRDSELKC